MMTSSPSCHGIWLSKSTRRRSSGSLATEDPYAAAMQLFCVSTVHVARSQAGVSAYSTKPWILTAPAETSIAWTQFKVGAFPSSHVVIYC